MAGFGFSISDLIQASNLAIQLYRRCRDSPNEFVTLASEGISSLPYKSINAEHGQWQTFEHSLTMSA